MLAGLIASVFKLQANVAGRAGGGGGIFKNAAVTVLREEKRLMSTGKPPRLDNPQMFYYHQEFG